MLVPIWNDDDRKFIAELYREKYNFCFKEAFELTQDIHAAEDIVNDVFVKLFGKINDLRQMEHYEVTSYIIVSIKNTSKRYLKNKLRLGHPVDFYNDDNMAKIKDIFDTERIVISRLDWENVKKAFQKLTDAERDFMIKSCFEQLGDRELSKQTGIKYNNIRTYRCRLLNKLQKLFYEESEEKIHG